MALREKEREINVPSSKSCGTFTLHRVRHEEENTSSPALKSGATVRSEILVILGHRAARQETSRVLFRFHDRILGPGFSGTEDALFDHRNTATRSASGSQGTRGLRGAYYRCRGCRWDAHASRAHFHNGLGTYYRTYVRIYMRARVTNRCITRRMHLARVTYHSTRFGLARLDGNLSKSNDTLRINLGNRWPL